MSVTKTRFRKIRGEFLHLDDCGSAIRTGAQVYGSTSKFDTWIQLRDCDRKIEFTGWGEDGEQVMLKKVDTLLEVLSQFRKDVLEAGRVYRASHPRKFPKKKNASR